MKRTVLGFAAAAVLVLAACGDDDDDGAAPDTTSGGTEPAAVTTAAPTDTTGAATTAAPTDTGAATTAAPTDTGGATTAPGTTPGGEGPSNIQASGECGMGTGEAASGEPIKIGAMATNIPGVDFTWITSMTGAYFECVNDNGGINGRPIEYIAEEEQVDPQQIASLATKLIEQDQVVGIVGSTSLIECSVNRDYYAAQEFYLIIAGVAQDCFTSPNFSAVNMGPYYSSLGGAQAAVRAGAEGKLVVVSPNQPGLRPDQQRRRRSSPRRTGWRVRASSRTCRSTTRPASPSASSRPPATAVASSSTSPVRPCSRCSRRSSSRA